MLKKIFVVSSLIFALLGCEKSKVVDGAKNANGATEVKYVICGLGEKGCFVNARFTSLDSCERHKKWSDMLCVYQADGSGMTCRLDTTTVAQAYCIP